MRTGPKIPVTYVHRLYLAYVAVLLAFVIAGRFQPCWVQPSVPICPLVVVIPLVQMQYSMDIAGYIAWTSASRVD